MKKWICVAAAVTAMAWTVRGGPEAEGGSVYLGGGAHYWRTINQLKDSNGIDDSGIAYVASIQIAPVKFVRLEGDVEIFPSGFAGATDTSYAPEALVLVGYGLYAGLGIGTVYMPDMPDTWSDPLYIIRAGLNVEALPHIWLDVNANYYFLNWQNIGELQQKVSEDTITFGAQVRIQF